MSETALPDVRLAHVSDLHLEELGDRRCQGLTHVVDLALEQGAHGLLIAGDFFDSNRVRLDVVRFAVEELARFGGPVVVAAGNHDCLVEDSVYNRGPWRRAKNVRILRRSAGQSVALDDLSMDVWGKPLTAYGDGEGALEGIPAARGHGRWQVAVGHGYHAPPDGRGWASFQITSEQIETSGRHYVALGDSHAFRCVAEGPVTAYYSGAPSSGTHTLALVHFESASGRARVERHSLRERFEPQV